MSKKQQPNALESTLTSGHLLCGIFTLMYAADLFRVVLVWGAVG